MIDYRVEGAIAWITLNREEKLNALNLDAWRLIPDAFHRAEEDGAVKVVVLSGRGRCFCAGADITSFSGIETAEDRYRFVKLVNAAFVAVETMSKPVIAAVHGVVLGGGCELSMMADIVIADTTVQFGLPEIRTGIMPGPGLVRGGSHVGLHVIKYMAYTGETLNAQEALSVGLANKIVEPERLLEEAGRVATVIAGRSTTAISEVKRFLNAQHPSQYDYVTSSLSFLFGTSAVQESVERFKTRKST